MTAKERVEIGPHGRVDGVVRAPRIRIDEGALVSARIEMGEPLRARSRETPLPSSEMWQRR